MKMVGDDKSLDLACLLRNNPNCPRPIQEMAQLIGGVGDTLNKAGFVNLQKALEIPRTIVAECRHQSNCNYGVDRYFGLSVADNHLRGSFSRLVGSAHCNHVIDSGRIGGVIVA